MSMRGSARWALMGLLAAISLPFFAVAKPPDLPVRSTVECADRPAPVPADSLEQLKGTLCPGIEDLAESCWRALLKRMPVTCAPGCCAEPATRFAVIEILPVAPKLIQTELTEDLRQIEYEWERIWFTDLPSHLPPQRMHGGGCCAPCPVERLTVFPTPVPQAAVREFSTHPVMCLVEENCARMPYADEQCPGCCKQQAAPQRLRGVVQAAATETIKPEKRSGWPRIRLELKIEINP